VAGAGSFEFKMPNGLRKALKWKQEYLRISVTSVLISYDTDIETALHTIEILEN